ncbi:MAG: winged helix-turn-helix transcriptional regulator [Planctomycetes bacterium]|nr:winged helix-turn-helix transcriptional regulator [Planctomycetota bacterium]
MPSNKAIAISQQELERFAEAFAAIGNPVRMLILRSVLEAHPEGLISSEIQEIVATPASTLSHHLEAMRAAGVLSMKREGRTRRYCAEADALGAMLGFLFDECCTRSGAVDAGCCLPRRSC